jgi:hypothetical protein
MVNLTIGTSLIHERDELFSLNDLHAAAGGEAKHQPALFLRLDQTRELIAEIHSTETQSGIQPSETRAVLQTINGGPNRGTYACRELVIAYAAWISAAFHLKVIRVFLAASAPAPRAPRQPRLPRPQPVIYRGFVQSARMGMTVGTQSKEGYPMVFEGLLLPDAMLPVRAGDVVDLHFAPGTDGREHGPLLRVVKKNVSVFD